MMGTPVRSRMAPSAEATSRAWDRDSIWHGPAIRTKGRLLPISISPTLTLRTDSTDMRLLSVFGMGLSVLCSHLLRIHLAHVKPIAEISLNWTNLSYISRNML